jgi:hypothetical protein
VRHRSQLTPHLLTPYNRSASLTALHNHPSSTLPALVLLNADGSDCQKFYIEADVIQLGTAGEQQHNNPAVQDIIVGYLFTCQ